MNHLNDSFFPWHCTLCTGKDDLLPCGNGVPQKYLNRLYIRILTTVAYRDPKIVGRAIGKREVYIPQKRWWGKFNVPFSFNRCLHDQYRTASFDLQWLKLWIIFTGHTSMAYFKWEWKIDHWLIKSTRHSLPPPQLLSPIVCQPAKQASLRSRQSVFQEVEHNVGAIHETFMMRWIINAEINFIVSRRIFILLHQRFKPHRKTISTA